MRTLFIGGSGFIGRNLIASYDRGDAAYMSRHSSLELEDKGIEHILGSVTDADKVMDTVKDFDVIVDLAGIWDEKEQKFMDVHLQGVKNIVAAVKKYDKNQKLIYFSAMNTDFGASEYYRSKRIAEDNVYTLKNGLVIKPSTIFGPGDHITEEIIRLAGKKLKKFPGLGNLAPLHIDDLVTAFRAVTDQTGTLYFCSTEKMDLVDAINIVREKTGMKPVKSMETKVNINKLLQKITSKGIGTYDELMSLSLNRFRETTFVTRIVKNLKSYREYLENYLSQNYRST